MCVPEPVSLTDLVVILINIMYQHPKPLQGDLPHTGGAQHPHTAILSTSTIFSLSLEEHREPCFEPELLRPYLLSANLAPSHAVLQCSLKDLALQLRLFS